MIHFLRTYWSLLAISVVYIGVIAFFFIRGRLVLGVTFCFVMFINLSRIYRAIRKRTKQ